MVRVKLRIIGSARAGKSSLISSFIGKKNIKQGEYCQKEFVIKAEVPIEGRAQAFDFYVVRDSSTTPKGCSNSTPIILCYNTTDPLSFEWAKTWLNKNSSLQEVYKTPILLVATQTNLTAKRLVTMDDGKNLAKQYNIPFMQASDNHMTAREVFLKVANINELPSTASLNYYDITQRLQNYISRIDGYPKYAHGFWFMKESRAANRTANYYLARELLKKIKASPLTDELKPVFTLENIKNLRDTITCQWSSFKDHGINSSELHKILQDIRKDLGLKDKATQVLPKGSEFVIKKGL